MTPTSHSKSFSRIAALGVGLLMTAALLAPVTPASAERGTGAAEGTAVADRVSLFNAHTVDGRELWRTDGTPDGTRLVKELGPGYASGNPRYLVAFKQQAFFAASTGALGDPDDRELWRSDGTAEGTRRVIDLRPGAASSFPTDLTVRGRTLFFAASDGDTGRELWRSDGSKAGTKLLKNIRPGAAGSSPQHLARVGRMIFFTADDGEHGRELWRTDGTAAGTRRLTSFDPAAELKDNPAEGLTAVGGLLYFMAASDRKCCAHDEVWRSDGTRDGTFMVKDIDLAYGLENVTFADVDGTAVFRAIHRDRGQELWRTRGSRASTAVLSNISPGYPTNVCGTLGGVGYFLTYQSGGTEALYRTDGTAGGTRKLYEHPALDQCAWERYQGSLYWYADSALWRTDGTGDSPELVKTWPTGEEVYQRNASGGLLYLSVASGFSPDEDGHDVELWRSDGTDAGTYKLEDLYHGDYGSHPALEGMVAVGS